MYCTSTSTSTFVRTTNACFQVHTLYVHVHVHACTFTCTLYIHCIHLLCMQYTNLDTFNTRKNVKPLSPPPSLSPSLSLPLPLSPPPSLSPLPLSPPPLSLFPFLCQILPHDPKARRLFVTTGSLKKVRPT